MFILDDDWLADSKTLFMSDFGARESLIGEEKRENKENKRCSSDDDDSR